ncbi:class I SAM-dependent DNA methyltransferase [Desulfotomaculum copahuensis]|uniref:Methyltransferase type 11 n=1 Tax=Desulfotomaculum copahuensis TaxID=1838280 RepID=A0A1B7LG14_9FIRM|nr:class I SAM-dependent methyltransferase [Desulfotomaculum copahuensis]OAT83502.1 methyltransferase type 11 [Desulfotomaculum copahuensis]
MDRYAGLAKIYDYLVAGVDFEGWIDYLEQILRCFNHTPDKILDLACGTGNTTLPLVKRGYRAAGLDVAPEMLQIARQKAGKAGLDINFTAADMRSFCLDEQFALITCFHDGLNYLTEDTDLRQCFERVNEHLVPGGLFVFDLNAVLWLAGTAPGTAMLDEKDITMCWESSYRPGGPCWEIKLTAFVREGEIYHKFTETHRERGYTPDEVQAAMSRAGLKLLAVYDAFTFNPVHPGSRRHFYVAGKPPV